ncbi:IS630 family transposase [Patescibacteria group bacterium]|nr:IS630 family transposase [Patescibacteria group bacterium]
MVEDEMSLNQETKTKNIWYFKGQEPLIEAKRKGQNQSFYGALNLKTGKETAITVKRQNSKASIEFLKKLGKIYQNRKIFLIWDNASWHKSKLIKAFLKTTKRFTLMNFPPYTPEFNPQERIWKALRQNVTHNRFEKDFDVLIKDCLKYLNRNNFKSIKFESLFGRD